VLGVIAQNPTHAQDAKVIPDSSTLETTMSIVKTAGGQMKTMTKQSKQPWNWLNLKQEKEHEIKFNSLPTPYINVHAARC
jgi:hypothetical protein